MTGTRLKSGSDLSSMDYETNRILMKSFKTSCNIDRIKYCQECFYRLMCQAICGENEELNLRVNLLTSA